MCPACLHHGAARRGPLGLLDCPWPSRQLVFGCGGRVVWPVPLVCVAGVVIIVAVVVTVVVAELPEAVLAAALFEGVWVVLFRDPKIAYRAGMDPGVPLCCMGTWLGAVICVVCWARYFNLLFCAPVNPHRRVRSFLRRLSFFIYSKVHAYHLTITNLGIRFLCSYSSVTSGNYVR